VQVVSLPLFSLSSSSGMLSVNDDDMFVLHFFTPTVLFAVVLLTRHYILLDSSMLTVYVICLSEKCMSFGTKFADLFVLLTYDHNIMLITQ